MKGATKKPTRLGPAAAAAMLLVWPASSLGAEPAWEALFEEHGISVWKREVPGSAFVEFRGRGLVSSPIIDVAAAIRDLKYKTDWMKNCVGSESLEWKGAQRAIVYNRTGSPVFFISDRDVVLDVEATKLDDEPGIIVRFKSTTHPKRPAVDGVVRMPKLSGHWKLVWKGPKVTEVEYQVSADPGGAIPAWLANWASEKLPLHTLEGLRRVSGNPRYEQDRMILERTVDWSLIEGGSPATKTATAAGR